ncbi:hypothetical protein CBR_g41315 [Chara braunii]|uniref:RNA-directed DNA polymerase n=1 Tax=Chara braunii TaxID=69332 RepID=A0A388LVN5_CHABU|nr:hypothetical protein CBR_g41315 [Chara braunii]|eukprot:GBG86321.1 hypothetical protein CBR_g41315 [Chara braunii]
MADGGRKLVMLDDLIDALDKRERAPSNIPKVDTFHFKGERVSDWLDLTEQALVGLSDEVKLQRVLRYVLHSHHQEVGKVVDAANGSWARFRDMMQRKYRLGDGLLTMADLEAMNKDDFSTIGAFVHEFKRKARKVHEISEETQCAIFLGLLTGSEASELTCHGGGNEKLTWATIDKGVKEGSLDQVEQHQVRLQRRKRKERDATASGTPGVKRIVTDVLAALGYDNEAEVQKRGVTVAQGRASGAVEEEDRHEDYGGEETGSQILTKAQRKQRNLQVGGQGFGKGQVPQAIAAPPPAPTPTSATAGPSCMGPPLACGHWAARTRSQNKAGPSQEPSQEPSQAPPRKEPEPGRRKEVVEVPEEEEEDDDKEDERLRQEEDQRAELRAKKRGAQEEAEPSLPDSVPKRKKYAVRMEEGFDVERMVDKLLKGHNDMMKLKDILASAPSLRGELKGRLSRRLVPNVHLSTVLLREVEWSEAGTRMDWKCVACGQVDLVIRNQKCTGMLDTGAEMNIIREKEAVMIGMEIDRSDHGMLHSANCKAAFCGTASNVIIEIGKVRARTCFFVMPDVDHPILLGRSFLCRTEMLIFNKHDGTMILLLCDPACGNYEVITCWNTGPGSGRNRPNLGSFTFEESENERRRPWEVPEDEDRAEVLTLSLADVNKAMEVVSAHDMADPEAIKALREQVLENPQDLQRLNAVTVRDSGGLSNADALSESCAGRPIILLIDLYSGYDQFPVYPPDRSVTAMHTPRGLIHMSVAPQGWTNAVAMVQRHMIRAMQTISPHITQPYIDDLAVKGPKEKEEDEVMPGVRRFVWKHVQDIYQVLGLLEEHNLTASGPKSKHCMREATILGFVCNESGRRLDVKKTDKILEWPVTFRLTYVRSFLGTCEFWRSFMKDFATKTEHLRKLVRQDQEWVWGEDQEEAVGRMKGKFREGGLVLGASNYEATEERPFIIETDATPTSLGEVLIKEDIEGKERPLRFESRTLNTAERNYSQFKKETLAVLHWENGCNYIFDARDNLTGFVDGRAIQTKTGPVLANCIEEYYLRYPFVREFVMDRGSEFTCNEVRTLLAESDFSKTSMQRGGRGTRPRQRPQGASGGDDSRKPVGRESTPIFDDGNIELFPDSYQAHATPEGWSTLERIRHLRGVRRFEEPIAHIQEEALTWQDVEARMQMLRASPMGPDGMPIRLEEGNAEEFIPAYEQYMRDQGTGQEEMEIERADRRIGEVGISSFQRYSMLSDELAASRLEVGQLSTQLAEERRENQAWRSRMEVKEAEWEKRLQDMAAMVERLSATKVVDWTEQSRYGIQGKEVQGLFGREGTTEPPQQRGMGKVFLDPIEAAARREAEEGRFSFRTPTELASQQATPMTIEIPEGELAQRPQPLKEEGGPTEESPTILLEVQEGALTGAAASTEPGNAGRGVSTG